jgi:MFS transporter, SP family, sugar:H+ symporter
LAFDINGAPWTNTPRSYVVLSEAASARVKEKTSLLACAISIITTFATSFTLPYLLNPPYAALGGRVGYLYGSICFAFVLVTYYCIPELKGRSLEDVDRLFAMKIPMRKMGEVQLRPVYTDEEGDDREALLPKSPDESSF